MIKINRWVFSGWLAAVCMATAQHAQAAPLSEPIKPLIEVRTVSAQRARLGERLFHDTRFSADNSVSCASCHDVAGAGGADRVALSKGVNGTEGKVNAPSVINASHNFRQFWDGRAESLEHQIGFVVENPDELASNWDEVMRKLRQDAALLEAFGQAYADGLSRANIENAIASYQMTLPSASRFDDYLLGNEDAISADELEGYNRFKSYGCIACHQGVNAGGNMYQKFGVFGDYFQDRGNIGEGDYGRFNVTGKEADRFVFKVPSLRNVALTAPYFHDGSAQTLEQAVDVMFMYQLGRSAPDEDKRLIVEFLKTLTGKKYRSER